MNRDNLSGWAKAAFVICGILIPLSSFYVADTVDLGLADWQSGKFTDYCHVLFESSAILWFFPGALISMVALLRFLFDSASHSSTFVRAGIPSGVFIAAPIAVVELFTQAFFLILIFGVLAGFIRAIHLYLVSMHRRRAWPIWKAWARILSLLLIIYILGCLAVGEPGNIVRLLILIIGATFTGPWFALVTYAIAWRRLRYLDTEARASHLEWWTLWSIGYVVCWSMAIKTTLRVYQTLPTHPPDCFIATAAAHGTPNFVGSRPASTACGSTFMCNEQVRYLKGFEIALMTLWPRGHRLLRKLYNWLGPLGASMIRRSSSRLPANAVYLAFKPFEWLARALLRMLAVSTTKSIYGAASPFLTISALDKRGRTLAGVGRPVLRSNSSAVRRSGT